MKLITAIAALALLAGSMDVEAQKRGKANNPPGGGKTPGTHPKAPEGPKTGHPHISPVAHLAIGVFGELDPEERNDLAEAAGEGDEEAFEELRAERVEAIEAMLGALEDPESRKMIAIGMLLGGAEGFRYGLTVQKTATAGGRVINQPDDWDSSDMEMDGLLNMVQEQLEELLDNWSQAQLVTNSRGSSSGKQFIDTAVEDALD